MQTAQAHFDPSSMLSFDLETTGTNPCEARIVTSALVQIHGRDVQTKEMLADPGIPIPESATAIHGITTEQARQEGRPHAEVLQETIEIIRQGWDRGDTLIVFNAAYDLTILRTQDPNFVVEGCVIDPLVLDRALDKERRGPRKLTALCEAFGITLDNAHEASADALAAARLAWKMAKRWPVLTEKSVDEIMEMQAVAYYDWQVSMKEYLESQGRLMNDFSTAWPMRG